MAEPARGVELHASVRRAAGSNSAATRSDGAFVGAVSNALGLEPPPTPDRSRSRADTVILWLGPDAWLIEVPAEAERAVARTLEESLSDRHASVAVVGAGSVTWSLTGPMARDLLAKGMTLDLDPERFRAGCCARSLLARVPVLLHRPGDDSGLRTYRSPELRGIRAGLARGRRARIRRYAVTGDSP